MSPHSAILHIAPRRAWQAAVRDATDYRDRSLDREGFIHCSTPEQVLIPANERFAGRADLVLLVVDIDLVPSAVVFEDCYESGTAFPHIYGPIPTAAVSAVVPFPCHPDGTFSLPSLARENVRGTKSVAAEDPGFSVCESAPTATQQTNRSPTCSTRRYC